MATGLDLIRAIKANRHLMVVNDCPQVPISMGKAMYGKVQNDTHPKSITPTASLPDRNKQIAKTLGFVGANDQTAVFHFQVKPTHHFVVIPWYQHNLPQGQRYTVFMAWENQYSVDEYVHGRATAPATGGFGYKDEWTYAQVADMLNALCTDNGAYTRYFGNVGINQTATEIVCYQYPAIDLNKAIVGVNGYTG